MTHRSAQTKVMGIVNVTPDSFSDGGLWLELSAAIAQIARLIEEGAAVIDVGGESTRPGADSVPVDVEMSRVVPVVAEAVKRWPGLEISVDTTKPEVVRAAAAAGATILNDVSGSLEDVAADLGVGWVAMHALGPSSTMQDNPVYDDVVAEVSEFLANAAARGRRAGIQRVWIDPGIGFGKTTDHNLDLIANLDRFTSIAPVLVGVSRKRTIGDLHALSDGTASVATDDRLEGSVAMAAWSAHMGADIVRVHDVRATVDAVRMVVS